MNRKILFILSIVTVFALVPAPVAKAESCQLPPEIELIHQGVGLAYRERIQQEITYAYCYLQTIGWDPVEKIGAFQVRIGPPVLVFEQKPAILKPGVDVDFFYRVEYLLAGRDLNEPLEPRWLVHGAAQVLTNRAADKFGNPLYSATVRAEIGYTASGLSYPLERLESDPIPPRDPDRAWGYPAAEYLLERSGGDPGKLLAYFQNLYTYSGDWKQAFAVTFGFNVTQFYDDFRAYRQVHYPNLSGRRVEGRVTNHDGIPLPNLWVWACPPEPTYDCFPTRTSAPTDSSRVGVYGVYVPPGEVIVAVGETPLPESIFGYYGGEGFTTKREAAALVTVPQSEGSVEVNLPIPDESLSAETRAAADAARTVYVRTTSANLRTCPKTSCPLVTQAAQGAAFIVEDTVTGQSVEGDTTWYRIRVAEQDAYIHRSLTTTTPP